MPKRTNSRKVPSTKLTEDFFFGDHLFLHQFCSLKMVISKKNVFGFYANFAFNNGELKKKRFSVFALILPFENGDLTKKGLLSVRWDLGRRGSNASVDGRMQFLVGLVFDPRL